MTNRVELKETEMEEVVGGHFNWATKDNVVYCRVDGVGMFRCTNNAKNAFAWLKVEHREDGWSDADYANALVSAGEFIPM